MARRKTVQRRRSRVATPMGFSRDEAEDLAYDLTDAMLGAVADTFKKWRVPSGQQNKIMDEVDEEFYELTKSLADAIGRSD